MVSAALSPSDRQAHRGHLRRVSPLTDEEIAAVDRAARVRCLARRESFLAAGDIAVEFAGIDAASGAKDPAFAPGHGISARLCGLLADRCAGWRGRHVGAGRRRDLGAGVGAAGVLLAAGVGAAVVVAAPERRTGQRGEHERTEDVSEGLSHAFSMVLARGRMRSNGAGRGRRFRT
jgi:hypothetical protein